MDRRQLAGGEMQLSDQDRVVLDVVDRLFDNQNNQKIQFKNIDKIRQKNRI